MPRSCTICTHPKLDEIDKALADGVPNRRIASQCDVSEASVRRHKAEHLARALVKAAEKRQEMRGDRLLDQVLDLQTRTLELLAEAERDGDRGTRLGVIREARSNLELIGRFLGELKGGETNILNVTLDPDTARRVAETYLARHRALEVAHGG
jgi:hypothetical protein